ncbi:ABC transporter ATP-binding protein [Spiroplasma apis]|uniref:ABC transporter ATP-binding protein n=1 Tax=Spiroplasma apis B31 TaxID=1276258 RepID=V5RHR9_SPIAP|nr:ABC transporter ATP-binding protein [Spiroplasma apis]AHB36232.1 ABC transporter ATP-binding protein [Spiroplasma apis B31]
MIEVINLSKSFKKNKNPAIKDISFKINKNDICLFCGPNGAGKTTTIKSIFQELKYDSGQIKTNQNKLTSKDLNKFAFFPDSNNIPLTLTVKEYIEYVGIIYKVDKKTLAEKLESLKESFNLEEHFNKKLKELSAGWKKRAIFAAILVNEPEYIFMDEPTANLDIASQDYFVKLVKELNKKGVTFFITTHQIEDFAKITNHLILINKGEVLLDKYVDGEKENLKELYLKYINENEKNPNLYEKIYKNNKK